MGRLSLAMALAAVGIPSFASAQHAGHHESQVVASPLPSDPYAYGLFQLHNFEYDSAATAFRAAQQADPANVMAYWGEAMTYNHPLWAYQDKEAGRAVLSRLGPDAAARQAKARNPREAMWLDAVEALYGEGSKVDRDRAYHARMTRLFDSDPADIEARSFYALATLGLAHGGRNTALYMRSAALLEEAFPSHPAHPGLLHYMIHSYDDPAHAPLGERAAARYAAVAPKAGHAQHMISHIYLALGRWSEVERANLIADSVVDEQRKAGGRPPAECGHYNEWLIYALDQQGKDSADRVEACRVQAIDMMPQSPANVLGGGRDLFNNWAGLAVRHGVETGRWPSESDVPRGAGNAIGRMDLAYGRLLAARRDPAAARAALAEMKALRTTILAAMPTERPDDHESAPWLDRAVAQGEAVLALAEGRRDEGLALLRRAAEAETALPVAFGPPILAKPGWEMLGDEYLALGRKADAADAYRRALTAAPGRRLSLAGLAKATS
ncbi:MAG TPA: hypothetical protein VFZ35_03380 [Sphingomicrobium sp.]